MTLTDSVIRRNYGSILDSDCSDKLKAYRSKARHMTERNHIRLTETGIYPETHQAKGLENTIAERLEAAWEAAS